MMSLDWDVLHFKSEGGYNISENAQVYISSLTFSVKSESWKQSGVRYNKLNRIKQIYILIVKFFLQSATWLEASHCTY